MYRYTKAIKRCNDFQTYRYLTIIGTSQETVLSIKCGEFMPLSKNTELLQSATTWINFTILKEAKEYILYDHTFIKFKNRQS